MNPRWALYGAVVWALGIAGLDSAAVQAADLAARQPRLEPLKNVFGTYNAAPRRADGRVDLDFLAKDLSAIRANTYNWLIWHAATDWDDLKAFLPLADERKIQVWVTLVPPSESPPRAKNFSEPFRLDYERWAVEIAGLSVRRPNLVAWSIDDFVHNPKELNPERMRRLLSDARAINPKLAFIPCGYYRQLTPAYAEQYRGLFDGILFPYRNESVKADLVDARAVKSEVAKIRQLFGGATPIYVDVYASAHSRLGDSTPPYVGDVMAQAHECADGVLVYCHPSQSGNPEKYRVIEELFRRWADAQPGFLAK
ncbi:MAG TPA: hypothetical protein P5555_16835 [Candidatus Paceibacterota bacterium]|nr:hypothetical protein [Verrucomicrobiota bacterium]HRZ46845.1 hypothetical protein [Candidatus Paceibacterota bacterium]HRZ57042.1 hypothetical protein [Candidatus Paceibacterota bacterium]